MESRGKMNTDPTEFLVREFEVNPRYANGVPNGWFIITHDALKKIKLLCPEIQFLQIKEKFAELCIYCIIPKDTLETIKNQIRDIIDEARDLSQQHCQKCGTDYKVERRGVGKTGMWWATLCITCYTIDRRKTAYESFYYDEKGTFQSPEEMK